MRKIALLLCLFLFAAISTIHFSHQSGSTTFPPLGPVSRIEVRAELSDHVVHVINDRAEIERIVKYVYRHRQGWGGHSDWLGVPVPAVSAYFYDDLEFQGNFGIGPGFFACQRAGDFASRPCSSQQERSFLELVGLPDYKFRR
jgi:hypothetical protein